MTDLKTLQDVQGVFFDFEGTLVTFQWNLAGALKETWEGLESLGISQQMLGGKLNYAELLNRVNELALDKDTPNGDRALKLVHMVYDRYDADALTRWQRMPGAHHVLKTLREREYKVALITNVGATALRAALEKLDIQSFFACVVSRNHVSRLKPDLEGLIKAADQMEVLPGQVLFVGDSVNDVNAARNAGMLAGYLVGGEDRIVGVDELPADIRLKQLSDLLGYL
jgi:phosphoglycolate phosphatase